MVRVGGEGCKLAVVDDVGCIKIDGVEGGESRDLFRPDPILFLSSSSVSTPGSSASSSSMTECLHVVHVFVASRHLL